MKEFKPDEVKKGIDAVAGAGDELKTIVEVFMMFKESKGKKIKDSHLVM